MISKALKLIFLSLLKNHYSVYDLSADYVQKPIISKLQMKLWPWERDLLNKLNY
jgi:hypothetical protein